MGLGGSWARHRLVFHMPRELPFITSAEFLDFLLPSLRLSLSHSRNLSVHCLLFHYPSPPSATSLMEAPLPLNQPQSMCVCSAK